MPHKVHNPGNVNVIKNDVFKHSNDIAVRSTCLSGPKDISNGFFLSFVLNSPEPE